MSQKLNSLIDLLTHEVSSYGNKTKEHLNPAEPLSEELIGMTFKYSDLHTNKPGLVVAYCPSWDKMTHDHQYVLLKFENETKNGWQISDGLGYEDHYDIDHIKKIDPDYKKKWYVNAAYVSNEKPPIC